MQPIFMNINILNWHHIHVNNLILNLRITASLNYISGFIYLSSGSSTENRNHREASHRLYYLVIEFPLFVLNNRPEVRTRKFKGRRKKNLFFNQGLIPPPLSLMAVRTLELCRRKKKKLKKNCP